MHYLVAVALLGAVPPSGTWLRTRWQPESRTRGREAVGAAPEEDAVRGRWAGRERRPCQSTPLPLSERLEGREGEGGGGGRGVRSPRDPARLPSPASVPYPENEAVAEELVSRFCFHGGGSSSSRSGGDFSFGSNSGSAAASLLWRSVRCPRPHSHPEQCRATCHPRPVAHRRSFIHPVQPGVGGGEFFV